jgi:hypothetical protein
MSGPELVFLHIPKTAGTSQLHDFNNYIGVEQVFWLGKDCPASILRYPHSLVDGKFVVGGHKPLSFYPDSIDPLYCAILRDPIERAISLFVYYTRPELAATEHDREIRTDVLQRMLDLGIDPDSMLNSIRKCRRFRREISNYQCYYLSRGRATFAAVRKNLQKHDFLVGTVSSYDRFHRELWKTLNRTDATSVQANRSRDNYASDFLQDAELVTLIGKLNKEDQKLVDWVETRHQGLWLNLKDVDRRKRRLQRLPRKTDQRALSRLVWEDLSDFWPPRKHQQLKWPMSRMMVVENHRLAYMPTSGALDRSIQQMMLELSEVQHKEAVLKFGVERVVTHFITGLMLEDRTYSQIRKLAAADDYFRFAIVYEPITRLVDIYQRRFVETRESLSRWPRLAQLVADVQGLAEPDCTRGITFREFTRAISSGRYEVSLWLPQVRYLPWSERYERLYCCHQLPELERDLAQLRGLSVNIDAGPGLRVRIPESTGICYADTLPAELPADAVMWRDHLLDETLLQAIKVYYAGDFRLYNQVLGENIEVGGK